MSSDAPSAPSQPPGQSYGQSYGQPYGAPAPQGGPYTHWGRRVASYLVDALLMVPLYVLAAVCFVLSREVTESQTYTTLDGRQTTLETGVTFNGPFLWLAVALFLAAIAFGLWNVVVRQGRTGRSLGKSALGTILLKEQTGRPLGAGMTVVRQLCHALDGILYLGYLWPLWDAKRQTFADKIVGTVVLDRPRG